MNQDKLHEITRLLDEFYAGDISGEDQSRLIALLRDGDDLHDHFIADRDLILSLHRPAPEMPQHLKSRVDAALQGEMRRTRFRRAGTIAGSVAASLIAIFATAGFWRESAATLPAAGDGYFASLAEKIEHEGRRPSVSSGTDSTPRLVAGPSSLSVVKTHDAAPASGTGDVQKKRHRVAPQSQPAAPSPENLRADDGPELYAQAVDDRYIIIDNPEVEMMMIAETFGSMENNLVMEMANVMDVYSTLASQLGSLYTSLE